MFIPGKVYLRRDLHANFGGQQQGGIATPSQHNLILLFTGEQGAQYGYSDGWTPEGVFLYTGEGQRGDMAFVRGNRAVVNHSQDGKDIHLFSYIPKRGFVRYFGQMVCTGHSYRAAPDFENNVRRTIVFELTPIAEFVETTLENEKEASLQELAAASLAELREKALAGSSSEASTTTQRIAVFRRRSRAIKLYVLKRSKGNCENCKVPAPFITKRGEAYLEPHHIRRLSDGGPDHPRWVIAVCPNCHRRAHYSKDAGTFNDALTEIVRELEADEN